MDYAATTWVDPRVVRAMIPYFGARYGNSVSVHQLGQRSFDAVEKSREIVAKALNADTREIIFTSSATESNNTALKGVAFANKEKGNHIIISSIEHDCVLSSAQWLATQGFEVTKLPVDRFGFVNPEDVRKAIRPDTILVSIMHANNEIGTIEPIAEIGKICREKGVYFHTDAAQSFGKLPIDVQAMNIDLLTASSHKLYGPKGVGLLYVRRGVCITPLLHGGGHEFGLRSSTVNVAGIVGFAKAVDLCVKEMEKESARETKLRNKLIKGIFKNIPGSYLNGDPVKRLPNNANVRFDYIEGEGILMELDANGIAASTASACSSPKLQPSHVLLAIGLLPQEAHGSLRLSIGRWTKKSDIDYTIKVLVKVVSQLREISPFKGNI